MKKQATVLALVVACSSGCDLNTSDSVVLDENATYSVTVHGLPATPSQVREIELAINTNSTFPSQGQDTMIASNQSSQDPLLDQSSQTDPFADQSTSPDLVASNDTSQSDIWQDDPFATSTNSSFDPAFETGFGLQQAETPYMRQCRAQGVPVPPPWGDPKWTSKGAIQNGRIFALDPRLTTELWVVKTASGSCAALPRKNPNTGQIVALGIICQSKAGKACFWDNVDPATQQKISDPRRIRPELISDGSNLRENCTQCHRGTNVFIIHDEQTLTQIPNSEPDKIFEPIGQPDWVNPQAADTFAPDCQSCHTLPQFTIGYCANVMMPTLRNWAGSPMADDVELKDYAADVRQIEAACRRLYTAQGAQWPW